MTDGVWHRNCSQCLHMPNCHSWVTLLAARTCPAYDDGTQAEVDRAKTEIHAFIQEDAGSNHEQHPQPP
ncbi:MAG: hypothetical protein JG718_02655 [Candidatus Thiothrix moscowensis]|nr:hypothetical protein [Candidatus Thiothrix moscowensis]